MTIKMPFAGICLVALAAMTAGCGGASDGETAANDDGCANFARGEAALANNDLATASVEFAAAAQKCETNFEARLNLALIGLRLGSVEEAARAAAEARTLRPDSAEALLVDGQAAYLKEDYARAIADFNTVAKEPSLPASTRSDALASRAVVEIAMKDADAARISLFKAIRLDRRNAAAWYHLGYVSRDVYHFDEAALMHFRMAAALMKANDERTLKLTRDMIPAIQGKLQQENASRPGAKTRNSAAAAKLIAEGIDLRSKKRTTNAIRKFKAAMEADPFSPEAALQYATTLSANMPKDAAEARKSAEKALGAYRVVIDATPYRKHFLNAARLAYKYRMYIQAATIMERAISHDPADADGLDVLIASLIKSGKKKQAEMWEAYRQSLK